MKFTKEHLKKGYKTLAYSIIGLTLAFIFLFVLNYSQYYVHELGHSNVAILSSFTQKNPSLTMNFTYVNFPLLKSLKVPQQTGATILTIYTPLFAFAGVFATILFYLIIFLLVSKIKIIRKNKVLEIPLAISFLILISQDIALNLFCGTDGLKLSCSEFTLGFLSLIFNGLLILSLGFFFAILFILRKNKNIKLLNRKVKKPDLSNKRK